ncbi:MAG TPA: hypothetical protein VHS36_06345 [Candidatus Limnocylindrales bacterium]|nr:hypothetical protein [Candidatus Limnocylindrales bacterium]
MTLLRGSRRVLLALVLIVLGAAVAFGLWHVVVGGLIHGNGRAGLFGAALAGTSGMLIAALLLARDRLLRT